MIAHCTDTPTTRLPQAARFTVPLPHERKLPKLKQRTQRLLRMMLAYPNCWYCGGPAVFGGDPNERPTFEHLRPVSQGGTSANENLVLACHRCNQARGSMPLRWIAVDLKSRRIVRTLPLEDDTDYLAPAPLLEGGAV